MDFNKQLMDERGYGTVFEPKYFSGQYKLNFFITEYKPGMYIIQKCGVGVGRLFMYWNEVPSVHQGYIYLRKKELFWKYFKM